MVDVGAKPDSGREAVATGRILMSPDTFRRYSTGDLPKGAVDDVARVAGIQAAKRTSELIPLCHSLALTHIGVDIAPVASANALEVTARVRCVGPTGVEMEALTAVTIALLTVYDMMKALDRGMRLEGIRLVEKRGGASGEWAAP